VNADCLKLTIYFGERDRAEGRFLADVLLDRYEHHGLATSILLRGIEGFGVKHRLKTQRLLTLSEDLPVVSVAVDTRQRIDQILGSSVERVARLHPL
jgi:PII-like signaling protein